MMNAYLVGAGIANLSCATLLIRDSGCDPERIHLFEALPVVGGSLDGAGNPGDGYVIRGGRMFEQHFGCTFDLLRDIPAIGDPPRSASEDILAFTAEIITASNARLVSHGEPQKAPRYELGLHDKWDLLRLSQLDEDAVEGMRIEDYFRPRFFTTAFWIMWSTMFAFKPCHSLAEMRRYMRRFMHLLPGFNQLKGIHRTRFNQYDAIVRPVENWLREQGVQFHLDCPVSNIEFDSAGQHIETISFDASTGRPPIEVMPDDRVFVTLGSMTEDSMLGSMHASPAKTPTRTSHSGAWSLWARIAEQSPRFGRPEAFAGDIEKTQWTSFTVTMPHGDFFEYMQRFTRNVAGSGGLVTFRHSSWVLSVVLPHQPHFVGQPDHVHVFWGYGLHPEQTGDKVCKPLLDCTGAEILQELAHHLRLADRAEKLFREANCIPCLMPNITTQFMPRYKGDRPDVIPAGAKNFAFTGQYVELPEDTVFTVEYSVRSAQHAVYGLCTPQNEPTPLYRGFEKPSVIRRALRCILQNGPPR